VEERKGKGWRGKRWKWKEENAITLIRGREKGERKRENGEER